MFTSEYQILRPRGSTMVNFERKGSRIMKTKTNVAMIDENFEINFYKVN